MIIGIIGGGQLGMMMAESAKNLGHSIIGLDPNSNCPLSYIADEIITADYCDENNVRLLVSKSNIITYEFENVNLDLINQYVDIIPQKSDALYFSKNRLVEKEFAISLEIPTPKFIKYDIKNMFFPSVIKTTTGGYDGKGQAILFTKDDLDRFLLKDTFECIVEELVDFDYEISVVATRDKIGNIVTYPIPINKHRNGILFTSTITDALCPLIVSKAIDYTSRLVERLDYVGTLAVEYFVKNEEVIFNEFAPRPHNSGHYTIEGCNVSQFTNHILAITGESVVIPRLLNPTIMINVLGQDKAFVERMKSEKCYYHDYKKNESKINRKMGHITIVSDSVEEANYIKNTIIKE